MAVIRGCQEGKGTPRLVEVKCPACAEVLEVFVKMGGSIEETGRTVGDEKCDCGYIIESGTPLGELEYAVCDRAGAKPVC